MILQDIFGEISAAGGPSTPMTRSDLETSLQQARAALAPGGAVHEIVTRLKNRAK